VIEDEDGDCSNCRHEHAPEIGYNADFSEGVEHVSAYERAQNAEDDVEDGTVAALIDDLARDNTRDEPEENPAEDGHLPLANAGVTIAVPVAVQHGYLYLDARLGANDEAAPVVGAGAVSCQHNQCAILLSTNVAFMRRLGCHIDVHLGIESKHIVKAINNPATASGRRLRHRLLLCGGHRDRNRAPLLDHVVGAVD
jgi:hypothetical protein